MYTCTCVDTLHVEGCVIPQFIKYVVSSILQSVSIWTRLHRQYEAATVVALLARRRAGACRRRARRIARQHHRAETQARRGLRHAIRNRKLDQNA